MHNESMSFNVVFKSLQNRMKGHSVATFLSVWILLHFNRWIAFLIDVDRFVPFRCIVATKQRVVGGVGLVVWVYCLAPDTEVPGSNPGGTTWKFSGDWNLLVQHSCSQWCWWDSNWWILIRYLIVRFRKLSDSGSCPIQEVVIFARFSCRAVVQSKEPPPLPVFEKVAKD